MLDKYGITAEQLHADALESAPEIRPLVIEGMAEVLAKQMGVEDLEMLGLNIPPEYVVKGKIVYGVIPVLRRIIYKNLIDL